MASSDKLVYGSYEVLQNPDGSPWILGEGNFGVTYKAHHAFLGRVSALKVIREDLLNRGSREDKEETKRFLSEARAVGRLNHPGIASVYDCALDNGVLYYAMEFCDGGTLQDECEKNGPMAWPAVRVIALQLASALDYAHDSGFLHRDIKPANIMLSGDGKSRQAKLIDFGLAKKFAVDTESSSATVRNDQENFRGNFATASPEQILEKELDQRSDLFSLGVTLWWLLIGRNPFGEMKRGPLIADRVGPSSYISSLPAGLDEEARDLLESLLEKDVEKRIPSAHAIVERLAKAAAPSAVSTGQPEVVVAGEALLAPPEYEDGYTYGTVLATTNQAKLYNGKDIITGIPIIAVLPDESLDPDALGSMRIAGNRRMDFGVYAYLDWRLSDGKDLFVLSKPEGCSLLAVLRKFGPARFSDALPFLAHLARCFDASMAWSGFGIRVDPGEILVRTRDGNSDPGKFHSWADLDPHSARCLPLFSSDAEHSASNEATLSTSAEEFPPLAQFAALVYRVLAGSVVKYAAFFTAGGYVMASGLSEDGNSLVADTLCDPASHPSAGHFLQLLAGIEALPIGELTPIVQPPTAADIATGKLPLHSSLNVADVVARGTLLGGPHPPVSDNSVSVSMKVAELERKLAKARLEAEEEARREAEEAARRQAEEEARVKAEEEARRQAEEEARRKVEEEARRKAEEEARRKVEEEARRKAEEEARRKIAKEKAEEEARRKADEDAKRKAAAKTKNPSTGKVQKVSEIERLLAEAKQEEEEEEKRHAAAEQARKLAEEKARREAETRLKEEEDVKRKADQENKRLADEQARRKAEEEAKIKAAQENAAQETAKHATPPALPSTPSAPATSSTPPPLASTPPIVDVQVAAPSTPAQPQTPPSTVSKFLISSSRIKLIAIAAVLVVVATAAVIMMPSGDEPKKPAPIDQVEKDRLDTEKKEKDRLAKLEADRLENERLAKLTNEQKAEAERQAKLAADKKAEEERLVKLALDKKAEEERLAKIAAEEKAEAARLAKIAAEKSKLYPITIKRSATSQPDRYRYSSFRVEEDGGEAEKKPETYQGVSFDAKPGSQWKITLINENKADLATVTILVPDGQKGRPLAIELPASLPLLWVVNPYKNADYTQVKLTLAGTAAAKLSASLDKPLKIGAGDFTLKSIPKDQTIAFPSKEKPIVMPFAGRGQWTITYTGSRLKDKTETPPVSNGEPMDDIVVKTPAPFSGHHSIIARMTPFPVKEHPDLKPLVAKVKPAEGDKLPEIDYFNDLYLSSSPAAREWLTKQLKQIINSYGLPYYFACVMDLNLQKNKDSHAGKIFLVMFLPEVCFAQYGGSLDIHENSGPDSLDLVMTGNEDAVIDATSAEIKKWEKTYGTKAATGDAKAFDRFLRESLSAWVSYQAQQLSNRKTTDRDNLELNFEKWIKGASPTEFRFELNISNDGGLIMKKALQVIGPNDSLANGHNREKDAPERFGAVLLREASGDPDRKMQQLSP